MGFHQKVPHSQQQCRALFFGGQNQKRANQGPDCNRRRRQAWPVITGGFKFLKIMADPDMLRKPVSDTTPAEPTDVIVTLAPVSALDVSDVYHTNDVRIEKETPPVVDSLKVQMEQVFILRRIDEVPERLQYPFVLTGYRHNFSFRLCLLSVFRWHNETVQAPIHDQQSSLFQFLFHRVESYSALIQINIWSHAFGWLFCLYVLFIDTAGVGIRGTVWVNVPTNIHAPDSRDQVPIVILRFPIL
jgi:hypothetical protein